MKLDILVGAIITFFSYFLLFLYVAVRNIYRERKSLKAEIQEAREQILLSSVQDRVLRLTRDMRSFVEKHQNYPIEPENPASGEFEEWSKKWSSWLAKFRAEYQERFALPLREVATQLEKLGIGDACKLVSYANSSPNLPDGCLTPIRLLFDFLVRIECQAADGRAEFIYETPIFTPLQIEAFQLAKDIRQFLTAFEAIPPSLSFEDSEKRRLEGIGRRIAWRRKLDSAYRRHLGARERELELKFGECGIPINHSTAVKDSRRGTEEAISLYATAIVAMAHRLDGVMLDPVKK
jgi:hypothetical protein